MKFSVILKKEEKEKYILICFEAWGCCPIDVNWAKNTSRYKEFEQKLYP